MTKKIREAFDVRLGIQMITLLIAIVGALVWNERRASFIEGEVRAVQAEQNDAAAERLRLRSESSSIDRRLTVIETKLDAIDKSVDGIAKSLTAR